MTNSFVRDLRAAAAAGVPIVCVVTHEERRARALVAEAFPDAQLLEWTSTRGWDDDAASLAPLVALEHASVGGRSAWSASCSTFTPGSRTRVWCAPCETGLRASGSCPSSSSCRRRPHCRRSWIVTRGSCLSRYRTATRWGAVLDAEMGPTHDAPETRNRLVRAALGLTLDEAGRAFRLASTMENGDRALERVIDEKRGALRRNGCLELIDAEVSLDDVGGLDVLKAWLRARVLAFEGLSKVAPSA